MTDPPTPSRRLLALFAEVDAQTAAVARSSGIRCPTGCATCCDNPSVAARVVEMMPVALRVVREGRAEAVLAAARAAIEGGGPCVFLQRHAAPPGADPERTHGRCGVYEDRPTLCRLFGFAGARDRRGDTVLAACWVHHQEQPAVMDRAHDDVADGTLTLPVFQDVERRVDALEGGGGPALPINAALEQAILQAWAQADRGEAER